MRYQLILICILLTLRSYAQHCSQKHPSGFCHNPQFVNPQGDTLNKLDSLEYYEGLHVYTDNATNIYSDSNTFIIGHFHHGKPIGEWKEHCKDGSYAVGQYKSGVQTTPDGKGGWTEKKQGIYEKIGVWKYYDAQGKLISTERYDQFNYKHGWAEETYIADSNGTFVLVRYESASRYSSVFRTKRTKVYTNTGVPVSADYRNFWKNISYEYYENGQVQEKIKWKQFLGKQLNTSITKEYTNRGELTCKTKMKCKKYQSDSVWQHLEW